MTARRLLPLYALIFATVACTSNNSDSCSTKGGQSLASSPWPKFRHDVGNTGRVDGVDLSGSPGACVRWRYPDTGVPLQSISTSPIIGTVSPGRDRVYLAARARGSTALLRLLAFDPTDGLVEESSFDLSFSTSATTSIRSTPLLSGDESSTQRIILPFEDGLLQQYTLVDQKLVRSSSVSPTLGGSPAIDSQGTVFVSSSSGSFLAICANGSPRFARVVSGTESSVALYEGTSTKVDDDVSVVAGNDGRVRAFDIRSFQLWTFSAADAIVAAPAIDAVRQRVYVADTSGRVFAVRLGDGRRCRDFEYDAGAPITASPAFGHDGEDGAPTTLFIADEAGTLTALDLTTQTADTCEDSPAPAGDPLWSFLAGGAIRSSPAVAAGDGGDVVVFGADDGCVYALPGGPADAGSPVPLWTICAADGEPIGTSSPAIGSDGTVYVGSQGGRLYAIESQAPCPAPASAAVP